MIHFEPILSNTVKDVNSRFTHVYMFKLILYKWSLWYHAGKPRSYNASRWYNITREYTYYTNHGCNCTLETLKSLYEYHMGSLNVIRNNRYGWQEYLVITNSSYVT